MTTDKPMISGTLSNIAADAMRGLGALVFWDMADTKITPDALRTILASEGLTIDVPNIEPDGAIKRAARTWAMGRGNDRYRADPVDIADTNRIKVCILHRAEEGSGGRKAAKWETVESVIFDRTTGSWASSATTAEVTGFINLANEYITFYDHNFIRPMILQRRLTDMRAFSLKASSGLWYVMQDRMADLAALQRVVAAIGNSAMHVIHVGGTESSRGAIESAARGALGETLTELEAKLEAWVTSTRKIRTDAIDTAMAEFADLYDRASLYQDALQIRMDDLNDRIEGARSRARSIIDGNLEAHGNPETKPLGKKALSILEAIEVAFPDGGDFTIRALEDVIGVDCGAIQTHLRDICRLGRAHRKGRDEAGAMIYALGAGDGSGPVEEDEQVEVDGGKHHTDGEMELIGDKQPAVAVEPEPVAVEPEPVVVEPEPVVEPEQVVVVEDEGDDRSFTIPDDEGLAAMTRDNLRKLAGMMADSGTPVPKASRLSRDDLARAIAEIRG